MRVGLFLSQSNSTISSLVKVDSLRKMFVSLSVCEVVNSFLSDDDQQTILKEIARNRLDAIVLVGDSPTCCPTPAVSTSWIESLVSSGINQNRIAFVNMNIPAVAEHLQNSETVLQNTKRNIESALANLEASRHSCPETTTTFPCLENTDVMSPASGSSLFTQSDLLNVEKSLSYILSANPNLKFRPKQNKQRFNKESVDMLSSLITDSLNNSNNKRYIGATHFLFNRKGDSCQFDYL
jgi:hypothetical protein